MAKSFSIPVFKQVQNQNKIIEAKWLFLDTLDQIYKRNEKVGNADKQKVIVIHEPTWVPGNHKYATGDNDTENFCKAVKEKVVIQTGEV